MNQQNSQYMQLAIQEAWKYQLLTYPNPAVGAVVVKDNKILSIEAHKEAGKPHAEVLALQSAYLTKYPDSSLKDLKDSHSIHNYLLEHHQDFFKQCEIYVTLEPCNHIGKTPACAMLLEALQIKKVFIGTMDPNEQASGGLQRLQNAGIKVETGVCKEQTDLLLEPFKIWQKKSFVFFKLAMREDGSIDGGYITSQKSLALVHEIRTKLDLLVIGGNTVRVDRPTLDARFAKKNLAPDILVYSSKDTKEFDPNINLFKVENREVLISKELNLMKEKNFIMIEGGYRLLEELKEQIDYLVVFMSHQEKKEELFSLESLGFKKVYSYLLNQDDELIFLK